MLNKKLIIKVHPIAPSSIKFHPVSTLYLHPLNSLCLTMKGSHTLGKEGLLAVPGRKSQLLSDTVHLGLDLPSGPQVDVADVGSTREDWGQPSLGL